MHSIQLTKIDQKETKLTKLSAINILQKRTHKFHYSFIFDFLLVKLLYNPGDRKFSSVGEKCWNENHVPAEAGPPGPRLSSPRERERKAVIARRDWWSICCSLCSVFNSLSHTTLSMKWEVYFSKEVCPLVFIASSWFCMHMFMYSCSWLRLYNTCLRYIQLLFIFDKNPGNHATGRNNICIK